MRWTLLLLLALCAPTALLTACSSDDDDSAADDDDDSPPIPEEVRATVRVLDGATGDAVEGVTATWGDEEGTTDSFGRVEFVMPSQEDFEIALSGDDIVDTWLQGNSGTADFTFTTAVGDDASFDLFATLIGQTRDPAKGYLTVALDTPAFQAATGASATIDAANDGAGILVNGFPEAGNELIFEAAALITFVNVDPGDATVSVTAPPNQICLSYPGLNAGTDFTTYDVRAGGVTVAQFICQ
jgi:hypothetical protein